MALRASKSSKDPSKTVWAWVGWASCLVFLSGLVIEEEEMGFGSESSSRVKEKGAGGKNSMSTRLRLEERSRMDLLVIRVQMGWVGLDHE